ncbi:MAG: UDP-3-O-(3-hydroxymyristoyl)glucosamine N-acyltransferase [Acidobacteriota bacterium]
MTGSVDAEASAGTRADALAKAVDATLAGDGALRVGAARALEDAGPDDLSFATSPAMRARAAASRAGALLVPPVLADLVRDDGTPVPALLVVEDPQRALIAILDRLAPPPPRPAAGVHPTAVVGDDCAIDPSAHVGPYAVVGARVVLGPNVVVHAHVTIGDDCVVGADAALHPQAVLYAGCVLGPRVIVHSGAVIGADGFGYLTRGGVHHKVPQIGIVALGADVEVGANSTIDRAALEQTVVGDGSKIDNLVQVGHNAALGQGCVVCAQSGIAGSSVLGDHVVLAGQVGVVGHIEVGDRTQVASKAAIMQSVDGDQVLGGTPAVGATTWRKQVAALARLPELLRRVRRLERQLRD